MEFVWRAAKYTRIDQKRTENALREPNTEYILENSSEIWKEIEIANRFFENVAQFETFGDDSNKLKFYSGGN